jgi:MFS transporter, FSR family, fosmidomycin resistance protein
LGLCALACGHLAVDLCTGIWPVYKTLAGLDLALAGLIATVGGVLGNGLQIVFGVLADRGWRKAALVVGTLLSGAVLFAPATNTVVSLLLLVLGTSVGSAAFHPAGTGAASGLSHSRTGLMVALFLAGGYVGDALSQLVFTATFHATGGQTGLLYAIPLGAAAAIGLWVPSVPGTAQSFAEWRRTFGAVRGPLSALFAIQVFTSAVNVAIIFLLPELLLARHAPGWMAQGGAHFALVLGGSLALVPAGHAADRIGARWVLVGTNVLSGLLFVAFVFEAASPAVALLLVAGFGAFNSANNVVAVAEGNRMLPGHGSGVSALLMGLPWCVASLSASIAGRLADPVHGGTPAAALGFVGLCIPLALGASLLVRRRIAR